VWAEIPRTYVILSGLRQRQTRPAMTDGEPFLAPGLRAWMVRMIKDNNQQFLGGDVGVIVLNEPRNVRCGQSLQ
jgi:hypothetical protein